MIGRYDYNQRNTIKMNLRNKKAEISEIPGGRPAIVAIIIILFFILVMIFFAIIKLQFKNVMPQ